MRRYLEDAVVARWISVGVLLVWSGCSSNSSDNQPAVGAAGAGAASAASAGTPAAVGGGSGRASIAPAGGAGQAGATTAAPAAGSGGSAPTRPVGSGGAGGAATVGNPATTPPSTGAPAAGSAAGTAGASGAAAMPAAGSGGASMGASSEHFSFFATSLAGLQRLSKNQNGFGGDLRYGQPDGLSGADKICADLAEGSMPGAGAKGWRAFLSVAKGPDGNPVNAIDRVGEGPWYDRVGRIVAMNKAALLNARPKGADAAIVNDLPNEDGVPNHQPEPSQPAVNNHHFLTGSDTAGKLYNNSVMSTCNNWTSADKNAGRPRIGFSYPAGNRQHWISGQDEGGCSPGAVLVDMGGSDPNNPIVGSGGGYGGFYCFALKP